MEYLQQLNNVGLDMIRSWATEAPEKEVSLPLRSNEGFEHAEEVRKSQSLPLSMVLLSDAISASAHSIDYVATNISPTSTFNGGSGNFTVTNFLQPGSQISFTLTVSINTQGNTTTYPATASFTATSAPAGAVVSTIQPCTFSSSSTTCAIEAPKKGGESA
jgi:hypothetical protein